MTNDQKTLLVSALTKFLGGLLFWAMPLVLGSLTAFLVMLPFPLLLVSRIRDEERIPEEGLPGYREYEQKVRFRLLPFIW